MRSHRTRNVIPIPELPSTQVALEVRRSFGDRKSPTAIDEREADRIVKAADKSVGGMASLRRLKDSPELFAPRPASGGRGAIDVIYGAIGDRLTRPEVKLVYNADSGLAWFTRRATDNSLRSAGIASGLMERHGNHHRAMSLLTIDVDGRRYTVRPRPFEHAQQVLERMKNTLEQDGWIATVKPETPRSRGGWVLEVTGRDVTRVWNFQNNTMPHGYGNFATVPGGRLVRIDTPVFDFGGALVPGTRDEHYRPIWEGTMKVRVNGGPIQEVPFARPIRTKSGVYLGHEVEPVSFRMPEKGEVAVWFELKGTAEEPGYYSNLSDNFHFKTPG